jgi:hypothetical protein
VLSFCRENWLTSNTSIKYVVDLACYEWTYSVRHILYFNLVTNNIIGNQVCQAIPLLEWKGISVGIALVSEDFIEFSF